MSDWSGESYADVPVLNTPVYETGGWAPSIPDAGSNVDLWGELRGTLGDLLGYKLKQDQLDAQVKVATAGRSVYPAGWFGSTAPGAAGTSPNLINLVLLGGLVFVGLKLAKVL